MINETGHLKILSSVDNYVACDTFSMEPW